MSRGVLIAALLAVLPPAGGRAADAVPRAGARPLRVMSISQCTDQIVLALLPPARIASVTWLSRDPQTSPLAGAAMRVPANHGTAEEVLRQHPDLVVAGSYTTTATRAMLRTLGWPMIEVAPAETIDQIRATTRRIARAVGAVARGEALIAHMDRGLAELARDPGPPVRVAAWDGGGFGAARGTLYDTVLTLAGAVNVAADPAVARGGVPDAELLLAAAPALLVRGGGSDDRDGLRADTAQHPIVRRIWGAGRTLAIRPAAYLCGTPFVADAALALRAQLRAKAAVGRTPPAFATR